MVKSCAPVRACGTLIRFIAGLVVALALLFPPVGSIAQSTAASPAKGYVVKEIRDGVYWLSDGAYNTIFVVSNAGVIAVDPLPTLGERYVRAVAEVTSQPITHIVYSHEHTDHVGAAWLFPKDAIIVAQQQTAELLKARDDPRRPLPTITFDRDYTLKVGDRTLALSYRGINHLQGNVFIYAPEQKVLMLVDVIYPGYLPYPNLGIAVDIPGYIQAHRDALRYDFTDFVGGHVDRIGTRGDVENSLQFVLDLQQASEQVLADKPFPAYLKEKSFDLTKTTWFAHDDYERDRTQACVERLAPKWLQVLRGTLPVLGTHCWSMIVGLAIQLPPSPAAGAK